MLEYIVFQKGQMVPGLGKTKQNSNKEGLQPLSLTVYFWSLATESDNTWAPDAKSWLIGKGPDAGKDWEQEEKGTTEDEMAGWHHQLDGDGFG